MFPSTLERVTSAIRHRMKQNRPQRMVKTVRKAPVLLPKPVSGRLGARSACVTAILFAILESKTARIIHAGQEEEK